MTAATLATGSGLGQLFAHPFMRNAFLAGTAIAVVSGLVGYFVVLRAQVFSGPAGLGSPSRARMGCTL